MKLEEMQACAAETLAFFFKTMPDIPFAPEDIVIEFAPKAQMAARARALCAKYVPDKIINDSQARQLNATIAANALIGREKSAVLVRIDHRRSRQDWRTVIYHELAHIYCTKMEMDESEHFVEVYGSGTTPENPAVAREERTYDGTLVGGYGVWSEFIAQYYALKHTESHENAVADRDEYINRLLADVNIASGDSAKGALGMACAYLLTCSDAENTVAMLKEPNDAMPQAQRAFLNCLFLIHGQMQKEKPWRIDEEFIADLGGAYIALKTFNSFNFDNM